MTDGSQLPQRDATTTAGTAAAGDVDWASLQQQLQKADAGTLYLPGDSSYYPLSIPQNHRYADVRPQGVVCPGNDTGENGAEGVSIAIKWAHEQGLPVAPRSNGHNYAGYSTTPGLLLNLSRLKNPCLIPSNGDTPLLKAGSGTTNADVYPWLRRQSAPHVAIPTGRCPSVALGGLVLGGGIGFSDRKYGLTCDTLVETTVVLADGRIVTANEHNEYSDLFWACRGGAGNNFGVTVDFTFKTHPVPAQFSVFDLKWPIKDTVAVVQAMQNLIADAGTPDGFHLRLGIGTSGRSPAESAENANCNAMGEFYGTAADLRKLLKPVLDCASPTLKSRIEDMDFWRATDYTFATTPVLQWGGKSAIVNEKLTPDQITACVDAMKTWPGSRNDDGAGIALFAMGGAINEVRPDATAFFHRNAHFIMALESSWADDDSSATAQACRDWLNSLYTQVWGANGPDHCYQNFPDPDLTRWSERYYGSNYNRLVEVKKKYDPAGMFHYGQSIGNQSQINPDPA
ncbi:FAD-binding oxidoreductase [Nocardiopsis gilva]|nr:FAD-binding oxidoreductase [Nocardiopsis gilva]